MNQIENNIYGDTSLNDILKEIHLNSKSKGKQIDKLILQLQPLIKNLNDATIIVPLIKEYLEVAVKNDEQLIKMANVAQKMLVTGKKSQSAITSDFIGLTEDELKNINTEVKDMKQSQHEIQEALTKLTPKS